MISFLLAIVAGFAGARLGGGREVTADSFSSADRRAGASAGEVRWGAEEFRDWAKHRGGSSDLSGNDWSEWSEDELRAALDEAAEDPRGVLGSSDERRIAGGIFGEWMRRNADAAVAWMDQVPSETVRRAFAGILANNWPKDRPDEGFAYLISHRDTFESYNATASGTLIKGAIGSAAKRGPEALDELFGVLRMNRLDPRYSSGWEFPRGI